VKTVNPWLRVTVWHGVTKSNTVPIPVVNPTEMAYNKNLTTLTCNGVPVKSILPALGYFLISCMRIESTFSAKGGFCVVGKDLDTLRRFPSFVLRVTFVVTLYARAISSS